ncbi:MAG: hypothetical protein PVJ92_00095 [Candidatus Dependentiae bacterium]
MKKMIVAVASLALVSGTLCAEANVFQPFKDHEGAAIQANKIFADKTDAKREVLHTEWTNQLVDWANNKMNAEKPVPIRYELERRSRVAGRKAAERWARHHAASKLRIGFKKKTRRQARKYEHDARNFDQRAAVCAKIDLMHTMYLTKQVAHLTETVADLESRLAALDGSSAASAPAAEAPAVDAEETEEPAGDEEVGADGEGDSPAADDGDTATEDGGDAGGGDDTGDDEDSGGNE